MEFCPLVTVVTLKPRIMSGITISRSFSVILVEIPTNISMLSHSVTPMAYKSLNTLAAAIFPTIEIKARIFENTDQCNTNLAYKGHQLRGRKNRLFGQEKGLRGEVV